MTASMCVVEPDDVEGNSKYLAGSKTIEASPLMQSTAPSPSSGMGTCGARVQRQGRDPPSRSEGMSILEFLYHIRFSPHHNL